MIPFQAADQHDASRQDQHDGPEELPEVAMKIAEIRRQEQQAAHRDQPAEYPAGVAKRGSGADDARHDEDYRPEIPQVLVGEETEVLEQQDRADPRQDQADNQAAGGAMNADPAAPA